MNNQMQVQLKITQRDKEVPHQLDEMNNYDQWSKKDCIRHKKNLHEQQNDLKKPSQIDQ